MFFVFKGVLERTVGVSLSFMGITMVICPMKMDRTPTTLMKYAIIAQNHASLCCGRKALMENLGGWST